MPRTKKVVEEVVKIIKPKAVKAYTFQLTLGDKVLKGKGASVLEALRDIEEPVKMFTKGDIEVSFGSKKYYLFPYMSVSWANDKNDDIDIIKEMQRAEEFVVTGVTRDGKTSNDTYSLIGFPQAYVKMKETCSDS